MFWVLGNTITKATLHFFCLKHAECLLYGSGTIVEEVDVSDYKSWIRRAQGAGKFYSILKLILSFN